MKIKHLLLSAFAAMFSIGGMAQSVPTHEMYVQYGQPDNIVAVLAKWEPGSNYGQPAEGEEVYRDENFFISRVPFKDNTERTKHHGYDLSMDRYGTDRRGRSRLGRPGIAV